MDTTECLTRALLATAMFLEFSDEDTVNPDAAVSQMEQIASMLSELDDDEKSKFLAVCTKMADEYSSIEEKAEYLASFGENYGLLA